MVKTIDFNCFNQNDFSNVKFLVMSSKTPDRLQCDLLKIPQNNINFV